MDKYVQCTQLENLSWVLHIQIRGATVPEMKISISYKFLLTQQDKVNILTVDIHW